MGQALYRRYRSKKLSEIIGQEHITETLEAALKQGRISHAYLFTGPRGVGKTSIARILAHEINGLPYDDDSTHLDIIEIDAASNRRIEEIRELREKVHVAPTSAKYKVYIIDEVHMLTREAFNALLKTLEEPPAHAVFILATTDAHKLPETIISRTQRFTFKPVEKSKVVAHLKSIADKEKISVSQEALELLAEHGEGSFRDSISLLDQAGGQTGELGADDVRQLLGIPPKSAVDELLQAVSSQSPANQVILKLHALYDQGYQAATIAKQLSQMIRQSVISGQGTVESLQMLQALIEVPVAHDPERYLELVLLQASDLPVTAKLTVEVAAEPIVAEETPKSATAKPVKRTKEAAVEQPSDATDTKTKPAQISTAQAGSAAFDEALWPEILQALKKRHNTLYGVVRMAQPRFDGDGLQLLFAFAFHQKRISEASNRQVLADIIKDLTGHTFTIECLVDKTAKPPKLTVHAEKTAVTSTTDIKAISNIFGSAELLES